MKKKEIKKLYKKLRKLLTVEEIAESFVLPSPPPTDKEVKLISDTIHKNKRKLSGRIKELGDVHLSWDKKKYTYQFESIDLLTVSGEMRDQVIEDLLFQFRISLQSTLYHGGMWGKGTGKEVKESFSDITNKKELKDLSFDDFDLLKKTGMLWEFYPEAPGNWNDIQR